MVHGDGAFFDKIGPRAAGNASTKRSIGLRLIVCSPFLADFSVPDPATALHDVFRDHGLEVVHAEVTYSQADYFDAFLPAYLACAAFEAVVGALGAPQLAAYILIAATKPTDGSAVLAGEI